MNELKYLGPADSTWTVQDCSVTNYLKVIDGNLYYDRLKRIKDLKEELDIIGKEIDTIDVNEQNEKSVWLKTHYITAYYRIKKELDEHMAELNKAKAEK